MSRFAALTSCLILCASGAFAAPTGSSRAATVAGLINPTIGGEINLSNRAIYNNQVDNYDVREDYVRVIAQDCPDCVITRSPVRTAKIRVTLPDGWYFEVITDYGVIEVNTKPSTVEVIGEHVQDIQKYIFDTGAKVNLRPAAEIHGDNWAASHMHFGEESTLGNDEVEAVRRLANILKDWSNHSELPLGVFVHDFKNAKPLVSLPPEAQENFARIMNDVDAGTIRTKAEFKRRIIEEVYVGPDDFASAAKNHAININRIANEDFAPEARTFEVRAMVGQSSGLDFYNLALLLTRRFQYVTRPGVTVDLRLTPQPSVKERALMFYDFVTETGLKFDFYSKYLDEWQKSLIPTNAQKLMRALFRNTPRHAWNCVRAVTPTR